MMEQEVDQCSRECTNLIAKDERGRIFKQESKRVYVQAPAVNFYDPLWRGRPFHAMHRYLRTYRFLCTFLRPS